MVTAAATSGAGVDMGDKEQSVDGERMQRGSSLDFIVRGSRNVDGIEALFTVINGGRRLKAIMDSKLPSEGGRVKRGIDGCVYAVVLLQE